MAEPRDDFDMRVDTIAEILVESSARLRRAVANWDDECILAVAARLESNENCRGFRCEAFDVAARTIRGEIGFRRNMANAKASGLDCYCVTCQGACKGEEEHDKVFPPKSPAEMRIHEMSRDKLIGLLCLIADVVDVSGYLDDAGDDCVRMLKEAGIPLPGRHA